ncbi:unnamed protein product [Polarella glacialis]|uniref:Uncharacterized protein n=1 Tax=Polarella glacialis TaxID=89957 RepID=A0A813IYJ5_POLGL|nr:unnamed protein product [Polarella glacialis]CAE8658601.1 unnamed protein product [Polarella glacialis]|mmetsp:Transcript_14569/g.23167  ORF Transcript_14569/g.23167 Transcript_14569/m.23167 type:complete len:152 (-) Transcript_14569:149-604(-)
MVSLLFASSRSTVAATCRRLGGTISGHGLRSATLVNNSNNAEFPRAVCSSPAAASALRAPGVGRSSRFLSTPANKGLSWNDTEDIADLLFAASASQDPLAVRFADLHTRVFSLEEFTGAKDACNEGKLEAIQMAWLELYEDEHGPSPSRNA